MSRSYLAGVLSLSLLAVSCASVQSKLEEIRVPPERIVENGYSLVPLNEKGWLVGGRNPVQLVLGKLAENPDESFVINSTLVKIGPYKTENDFVRLVKASQEQDNNPQRFKVKKFDVSAYDGKGTECAKTYAQFEDNAAARKSGNTGTMILEVLSLSCAHPKNKSIVVYVGYSQRYYPGHEDKAFLEKAMTVLNSLEFTDL